MAATAALSTFSCVSRHVVAGSGRTAPSDKLNIGCVGVGGMQGASDVRSVATENIYAMCDVDERFLKRMVEHFPKAKLYSDYREMIDKEHKNLDGITITIPDHMHASVALYAMERGVNVYCQKPLTQRVWEARLLKKAAKKYGVVTQMGNQGYSSESLRQACETIWRGDLGDVTEVHSWSGGGFARDITAWPRERRVPSRVNWDVWMGRTQRHAYSPRIHPSNWRGFQEYGSQMIGDWGVHQMGPAHWALQLDAPTSVECVAVEGVNPVSYPHYACKFEFPERPNKYVPSGKMPPMSVHWYEGNMARNMTPPAGLSKEELEGMSSLFIGAKCHMGTGGYGSFSRLIPESHMQGYEKPAPVVRRSPGHFQEWIEACKDPGKATCSNFSVAAPFTEWLLLGAISWRFPNEKLLWDGKNLRFTNNEAANDYVKPTFRRGWKLKDISI